MDPIIEVSNEYDDEFKARGLGNIAHENYTESRE